MKVSATARIQLTVEVPGGTWGDDCKLVQVFNQASDEARKGVKNLLDKSYPGVRIIGEPKVIAILTSREEP